MIISRSSGYRGQIFDLDTNRFIPKVIWADTDLGTFEAYCVDLNGDVVYNEKKEPKYWVGKGRIKFVPAEKSKKQYHIPICEKTGKPVTVLSDCPCPACRPPVPVLHTGPVLGRNCEHYGCTRTAEWSVSDEIELSPVLDGKYLYTRGHMVGQRFYCSWHYKPPKIVDEKGETVTERQITVRPQ
jgi:hypothetical protein